MNFDGFALRAHAQTIFTQHHSIVRITFLCGLPSTHCTAAQDITNTYLTRVNSTVTFGFRRPVSGTGINAITSGPVNIVLAYRYEPQLGYHSENRTQAQITVFTQPTPQPTPPPTASGSASTTRTTSTASGSTSAPKPTPKPTPPPTPPAPPAQSGLHATHAALMTLAFAVLLPLGAMVQRYFKGRSLFNNAHM